MKRLVIIDGKSIFYRGYYAMPGLSLKDGTPTGGVYGFASLSLEVMRKLEPDYVAVAWDKKGTSIRRRLQLLPTYKAGRKTPPDDFFTQIPILKELLGAFSWPLYEADDYEADDIMGGLARKATEKGIETCLITSDLDMLQVISPLVHVYALKKGFTDIEQFNVDYLENKYGIKVDQLLDLKALKGDSSDNITGVPGIGEKTAIQLLKDYGTLDNIYSHLTDIKPSIANKLKEGKDSAYLSKEIGRIWYDAPINLDLKAMDTHDLDANRLIKLLKKLEFSSLLRRLPKYMQEERPSSQASIFDSIQKPTIKTLKEIDSAELFLKLNSSDDILMYIQSDDLYVSIDKETFCRVDVDRLNEYLIKSIKSKKLISYNVKEVYHYLEKIGVDVRFEQVHDISQAAFLLDSLIRERSISTLAHEDINEDNTHQVMSALWDIYDSQLVSFNKEPKIAKIAQELDFPLVYVLYRMEKRGIKIDKSVLEKMSYDLGAQHKKIEQEIFSLVGHEFNIGSPSQLSEVLFATLQLPTAGIKKGKTAYSTGQKELDKLKGSHPIIELIEKSREIAKLKNTYIDVLPGLTDNNSRIHTTFNQDIVNTGRLSSTNPNLQNIPIRSELGREIRKAFVPERGNVFVNADYSQFELRLSAFLAKDEILMEDFNEGIDIHTKTASEVYGIPVEDVTKDQRRAAKVINFGVLYGMSPQGLAAATGMKYDEAKKFIEKYFEMRLPIRKYIDNTLKKAEDDGFVETYFGRKRPTPDVKTSNFMIRESAKRAAVNMPIQGTEADLMKMAMLKVDESIKDLGEQILQVHDSILIECPASNAEKISKILREAMENVSSDIKVKLKVDINVGENWGDL